MKLAIAAVAALALGAIVLMFHEAMRDARDRIREAATAADHVLTIFCRHCNPEAEFGCPCHQPEWHCTCTGDCGHRWCGLAAGIPDAEIHAWMAAQDGGGHG